MSPDDDIVYHLALGSDWAAAQADGVYRVSTRGKTLDDVGFIHCSFANQLARTANRFYSDEVELMVLEIDAELCDAELVVEPAPDGEAYPHLYGPLPTTAVVNNFWWERGEDGIWHGPPCLG